MNETKNASHFIKSKLVQKLFVAIIFIIFLIHIATENVLEKICATCVQKISSGALDGTFNMEDVFHRRKKILERSCSFIKQLKTANRIASVNELKEIHLLLHDLEASTENVANKLQSYDETETLLNKTQESFMIHVSYVTYDMWHIICRI